MSDIFNVPPTREQLISADHHRKAWVSDSYLMCNGYQGLKTPDDRKSYEWLNQVIVLKGEMTNEGHMFEVDKLC